VNVHVAYLMKSIVTIGLLAALSAQADEPAAPLSLRLTNLRSQKGKVLCTLYDGPRGFPTDATAAAQRRQCPIEGEVSICRFAPIQRATYAVACFHDENDNGKLDTGLFGIPSEGTVVSNEAKGSFGPPKYDDAKFEFPGRATELSLHMSY